MSDEHFEDPKVEYQWLTGLTASARTPERVSREAELKQSLYDAALLKLQDSYDLAGLRRLLPNYDLCYGTLRHAASIRLPEDVATLASLAPGLQVEIANLQADVSCYRCAAKAAVKKIELAVDKAKGIWYDIVPVKEQWRADGLFKEAASPLLQLRGDAEIVEGDTEQIYWILSRLKETLDKVTTNGNV